MSSFERVELVVVENREQKLFAHDSGESAAGVVTEDGAARLVSCVGCARVKEAERALILEACLRPGNRTPSFEMRRCGSGDRSSAEKSTEWAPDVERVCDLVLIRGEAGAELELATPESGEPPAEGASGAEQPD